MAQAACSATSSSDDAAKCSSGSIKRALPEFPIAIATFRRKPE